MYVKYTFLFGSFYKNEHLFLCFSTFYCIIEIQKVGGVMEIQKYQEKIFEDIKHFNEFDEEYWEARELMKALGYSKWEK